MNNYEKMIAAMQIFNKYEEGETSYVGAFHDEIHVGFSPEDISSEDALALEELGWFDNDGWMLFT